MQRRGSPFTGLGPVFLKEFSDHLSSARMMVLMLFIIVFGGLTVYPALQELRNIVESDPFLFLRIFTPNSNNVQFTFTAALSFVIPLLAIGLGFDAVNSEFNRRTLSRVLSQPLYRDALLLGKFLGGLATLAVVLTALWLIVLGVGLLLLGLPPRGVEVLRGFSFLLVAIAYGGVWLAAAILFSVIFRSTATSALCALGLWLFFTILWSPLIVPAVVVGFAPTNVMMGAGSIEEQIAVRNMQMFLDRLSPTTLFSESVLGLLNPETRTLGPVISTQLRGAILGAPLPFGQSLLMIWPQITGLVAGMIAVFTAAYVIFQREEVRA